MCGIFGVISGQKDRHRDRSERITRNLYRYSESRGKEASGVIALDTERIRYIKDAIPATELIGRKAFKALMTETHADRRGSVAIVGHSRLVTNGVSEVNANNQPIRAGSCIGVHNGIVTNEEALWKAYPELQRMFDIDTELLFRLLDLHLQTMPLGAALEQLFDEIEGVANIAVLFDRYDIALLATNNGSLFYLPAVSGNSAIFASERYILEEVVRRSECSDVYDIDAITHIPARSFVWYDLRNMICEHRMLGAASNDDVVMQQFSGARTVADLSSASKLFRASAGAALSTRPVFSRYAQVYEANRQRIAELRRCTRCILPETMPFIVFDDEGVCNYCRKHQPHVPKGRQALEKILQPTGGAYDCLVTLSGGRDSSYGLHYVKKELGLSPVTFTYDWGMVTDLARRNQMRMCGKLGVEHILISADIKRKRENIRRNVAAWLKRPDLGMIPLFMAGDKQYFYWAHRIAAQTGCDKIVLCENLLETTRFKSGFCGIAPLHGTANTYTLSLRNKFQMAFYYGRNFVKNPAYFNRSILDTISAFSSYYVMKHDFVNLFDYIPWDEKCINDVIIDSYNWETAPDSTSTWRIGDGTAAFYNYIYFTMAGLTENDTFRSNQIREGQIGREEALRLSEVENRPRFESILWYLDTIGLEFEETLERIHQAPKLY